MVDYVRRWNERTEIPARKFVAWLGIGQSKFHDWKDRYGKRNEHNGWVPRDWWLEDWEKQALSTSLSSIRWKATGDWRL